MTKTPKNEEIENRKNLVKNLIDKAFKLYPSWQQALNLPKPIYPAKLAGVVISNKQMAQVPLDEIRKSVLCGTLLSDSSFRINKGYANARFQARHSTRQYTWFVWKYLVLLKEFTNTTGVIFQYPDGYQVNSPLKPGEEILGKLKIASKADPKLTELHKVVCVHNVKTIQRSWLNHMNSYFLMTIWLDDGSLYNGCQGLICFSSTPVAEQNVFRQYLLAVWGIKTSLQDTGKVMKNGQINYRITIDKIDSLLKLLRLIAPIIPVREMLYKVCFIPKNNPSLLQRWKTELLGLVRPEFCQDIEDFYKNS